MPDLEHSLPCIKIKACSQSTPFERKNSCRQHTKYFKAFLTILALCTLLLLGFAFPSGSLLSSLISPITFTEKGAHLNVSIYHVEYPAASVGVKEGKFFPNTTNRTSFPDNLPYGEEDDSAPSDVEAVVIDHPEEGKQLGSSSSSEESFTPRVHSIQEKKGEKGIERKKGAKEEKGVKVGKGVKGVKGEKGKGAKGKKGMKGKKGAEREKGVKKEKGEGKFLPNTTTRTSFHENLPYGEEGDSAHVDVEAVVFDDSQEDKQSGSSSSSEESFTPRVHSIQEKKGEKGIEREKGVKKEKGVKEKGVEGVKGENGVKGEKDVKDEKGADEVVGSEHVDAHQIALPDLKSNKRSSSNHDKVPQPRYVVCTRVRNEAPYLREWIEYHLMIGFHSFFILNDGSVDANSTQCILDSYAERGVVFRLPTDIVEGNHGHGGDVKETMNGGRLTQGEVFGVCVNYLKSHPDRFDPTQTWMMTHDVDEFVFLKQKNNINDAMTTLLQYNPQARSLEVPRLLFGSSGNDYYTDGLVMDRFTQRYDHPSCPPKLFNHHQMGQQKSYCDRVGNDSYDSFKSISLVSSMAQCCKKKDGGGHERCHNTHRHTVFDSPSQNQTTCLIYGEIGPQYMAEKDVGKVAVIMHYMVKSRQEFYSRICESQFSDKYFRCEECTPETHFNLTETYSNNYNDARMTAFSKRVKKRLDDEGAGASCNAKPALQSLDHYRQCFDRIRKKLGSSGQ